MSSFWDHTVLEIYPKPLSGDLPTEGTPADWIANDQVFYAQSDDELVVYYVPLVVILWIKAKKYIEWVHSWVFNNIYVYTPWGKRRMKEVDERLASIPTLTEEEVREIFADDEEYDDFLEVVG